VSTKRRLPAEGEGIYPIHRHNNDATVPVFTAWMPGNVSKDALNRALIVIAEIDRRDAVTMGAKDCERLDDALSAVSDLLNTVPPGRPIPELNPGQRAVAAGGGSAVASCKATRSVLKSPQLADAGSHSPKGPCFW
jgi:hypothetical protein